MRKFDWGRLNPRFWLQNYPTSDEWDMILNDLLDKHPVVRDGDYAVKVGPITVWTSNYPYSYGKPWEPSVDVLPRAATRIRLKKAIPNTDPLEEVRAILGETK